MRCHPVSFSQNSLKSCSEMLLLIAGICIYDQAAVFYIAKWDEIFMEYVNQARAYLKINPNYRFHFSSSLEILEPLIDKLNNELNDYLERKEE